MTISYSLAEEERVYYNSLSFYYKEEDVCGFLLFLLRLLMSK